MHCWLSLLWWALRWPWTTWAECRNKNLFEKGLEELKELRSEAKCLSREGRGALDEIIASAETALEDG